MGVWEFVVVYLVAFVLLQLVIYRYLRGRSGETSRMAFAGPPNTDRGVGKDRDPEGHEHRRGTDPVDRGGTDPVDRPGSDGDPFQRCPNCGATNDPEGPFTFCRNCASRLPG